MLLGRLDNGLGYYRFVYNGSAKAYVGVIAQEVRAVRPDAVAVGRDGYLRVSYERLGLPFRSYDDWAASGGWLPKVAGPPPAIRSEFTRPKASLEKGRVKHRSVQCNQVLRVMLSPLREKLSGILSRSAPGTASERAATILLPNSQKRGGTRRDSGS